MAALINIKNISYKKIYFYTLMLFAFTMPLSRALITFFVFFLIFIWVYEGDFHRKYQLIKQNKLFLAFSLFFSYSVLSTFFSHDTLQALHSIRLIGYWIIIFIIMSTIQKEKIDLIISAFLMGMFTSEIIAYGIFFDLWSINNATAQDPTPFMSHIEYSLYLAFTSILLLNRLLSSSYSVKEKLFISVFFLTTTGNLFLTAGRTGQVSLIAGIIVMVFLHYRMTLKSFIVSTFILITIFSTAYNASYTFKHRIVQGTSDINKIVESNYNTSIGLRAAFYITYFNIIKENPFGVGLGDYKLAQQKEMSSDNYNHFDENVKNFISQSHPHNQYLLTLVQMGFLGFILLIYLIYSIATLAITNKELKKISVLFVVIFFTSCMAEPLLIKQFGISLFILFVGLFGAAANNTSLIKNNPEAL